MYIERPTNCIIICHCSFLICNYISIFKKRQRKRERERVYFSQVESDRLTFFLFLFSIFGIQSSEGFNFSRELSTLKFLKFQNFTLDAMSDRNNSPEKFSREKGLEFLKFQSFTLDAAKNKNSSEKVFSRRRSLKFSKFQRSSSRSRSNNGRFEIKKEKNCQKFSKTLLTQCESQFVE